MASVNFQAYDRTLRRKFMLDLMDQLDPGRRGQFRASLVFNAHTGLPIVPEDEMLLSPVRARARNPMPRQ